MPISWAETFTALQQGLVDGQCYGYITFLACKFNEVQKYITEVHYTYQLQPMILSQRAFRKMSPEMQTLITDAGRDAQEYCLAFQLVEGVRARQRLIESGVQIDQLEDEADWCRHFAGLARNGDVRRRQGRHQRLPLRHREKTLEVGFPHRGKAAS